MTTDITDDRETTTSPAPERPPAGDKVVATVSHVVLGFWTPARHRPAAVDPAVVVQDEQEIFASPFSLPADWNFDNYVSAWTTQGIGRYFLNTVIVVGCALVIVMILGVDVRLRARVLLVPRAQVHLLLDARRV